MPIDGATTVISRQIAKPDAPITPLNATSLYVNTMCDAPARAVDAIR